MSGRLVRHLPAVLWGTMFGCHYQGAVGIYTQWGD
jgi:hypothetical protein